MRKKFIIPLKLFIKDKKNENKIPFEEQKKIQDEWPSLINAVDTKITKAIKIPKLKSAKEEKTPPNILSTSKSPIENKNEKAWGTSPIPGSTPSSYSLMDIINEEMKNAKIGHDIKTPVVEKKSDNKKSDSFKGWNLNKNNLLEKSSFSKIIEMEEKSTLQYNKIKNRPLNSIQLEEKAIEDLKKLYKVDLVTDVTISIELIDECDFNDCLAPLWKKK